MKKLLLFLGVLLIFTSCKKEIIPCQDCYEGYTIIIHGRNDSKIIHETFSNDICELKDWMLHYKDTIQQQYYESYERYDYYKLNVLVKIPDMPHNKLIKYSEGKCGRAAYYFNGIKIVTNHRYPDLPL